MLLFIGRLNVLAYDNLEALDNLLPLMRKESKMSVLSQQKSGASVIGKSTRTLLSRRADSSTRAGVTAPGMHNIPSLLRVHKIKVRRVRQQLVEGRYDFDERLDAAVDRLIATVATIGQRSGPFVSNS